MPCPLNFAEKVAVRAGELPSAVVIAFKGTSGVGSGNGELMSLMQMLPPRFCSWQRLHVDERPRFAHFAAAASTAQEWWPAANVS